MDDQRFHYSLLDGIWNKVVITVLTGVEMRTIHLLFLDISNIPLLVSILTLKKVQTFTPKWNLRATTQDSKNKNELKKKVSGY